MPKIRSRTDAQLKEQVASARSYRMVLHGLGLVPAGGNYVQVKRRILDLRLDTSHFVGQAWNKGWRYDPRKKPQALEDLLVSGLKFRAISSSSAYTLKDSNVPSVNSVGGQKRRRMGVYR